MRIPIDEDALPPLVAKARRAMQEAAKAAVEEHWRAGRPVYIWKDEQVMALYADGTCVPARKTGAGSTSSK
jgi:hypothetical protein